MAGEDSTVVQISNISPSASRDHLYHMFSYFGRIQEFKIYPSDANPISAFSQSKICYIRYERPHCVATAQHMTNTVFVDRALVCVPVLDSEIPSEDTALKLGGPSLPGQRQLPPGVTSSIRTIGKRQVTVTHDPKLSAFGLPLYPPLPAQMDESKIEEIRRTIYVGGIPKEADPKDVMQFLNKNIGEVMYLRMAGPDDLPSRFAYVEFSSQHSIPIALQKMGLEYNGSPLEFHHSTVAVVKPQTKLFDHAYMDDQDAQSDMKRANSKERSSHRSRSHRHRTEIQQLATSMSNSPQIGDLLAALTEQQRTMATLIASLSQTSVGEGSSTKTSVPSFPAFDGSKEKWDVYVARLGQHFEAHRVLSDNRKRAYFLSWVGSDTFELLQKLFAGDDVTNVPYDSLVSKLSDYWKKSVHVMASRCLFYRQCLQPGQSYAEWIANLRGIGKDCQFLCPDEKCGKPYLDSLIRDVIVTNTPDEQVRVAALQQSNPSLAQVIQIAEAHEVTRKALTTMKQHPAEVIADVQQVGASVRPTKDGGKGLSLPSCSQCFRQHDRKVRRFRLAVCHRCKRKGHIAEVCNAVPRARPHQVRYGERPKRKAPGGSPRPTSEQAVRLVSLKSSDDGALNGGSSVHYCTSLEDAEQVDSPSMRPLTETGTACWREDRKIWISLKVNGSPLVFQVDTGATSSMVGLRGWRQLGSPECVSTRQALQAYGGITIPTKGFLNVHVALGEQARRLTLLVTDSEQGSNLMGLDWKDAFSVQLPSCNVTYSVDVRDVESAVKYITGKYEAVFRPNLGTCTSFKAHLNEPNAQPKVFKPRPLPFALMDAVKAEAQRLTDSGIWKPVPTNQWAAPIVVVKKSSGGIRICGDFKVTVNPQLEINQFPIPRLEELLVKLQHGQHFSKIDLADAYLQIELDEASKALMVVNTPFGLFQYQRLPFGVASAPAIFQQFMAQLISGVPGCAAYLDDIIVTGKDIADHVRNLEILFDRLTAAGLRCKLEKCTFFRPTVEYVGHIISANGIRPSERGVEAIRKLPCPRNLQELQVFIGKVNYYAKFLEDFAKDCAILNALRQKNVPFVWTNEHQCAFERLKEKIANATLLVHFQEDLPVILATDASQHGVGAVLLHRYPDGTERPIAHASKTLSAQQKGYSQVEKEGLAIVFGVKKFHRYLYGRHFELLTDHKPLVSIFNPSKALPVMTAQRLQRWAITLMAYSFNIKYKSGAQHNNADALSRLPMGPDVELDQTEANWSELTDSDMDLNSFPIDSAHLARATADDPVLKQVVRYVTSTWPSSSRTVTEHVKPYWNKRNSISLRKGILLYNTEFNRVIVPSALQEKVIQLLHHGHFGTVRMKQLARRYCWWPKLDARISEVVSSCASCTALAAALPREYQPWPIPDGPWERIHIDYAGPFWGQMWLICIDPFSKFPYVAAMSKTTTGTHRHECLYLRERNSDHIIATVRQMVSFPTKLIENHRQICLSYSEELRQLHSVIPTVGLPSTLH
uniref:RNA-directed DNA polymerase n=1 Tax=Trichuris muris TaxID=70415 RepID=A0A5S6QK83_TRIMR